MKSLRKILLSLLLLVLPITVFAAGSASVNRTSLNIEKGSTATFDITYTNAAGTVTITSSDTSVVTVNKTNEFVDKVNETGTLTVTATGVNTGTATITVALNLATYDEEEIIETKTISVNVTAPKSTNNNLSDIKIDGTTISGFSPSKLTYDYTALNSSINVTATLEDQKATIVSGTGTKTLGSGVTKVEIIVRAESGTTKTYTINVTKAADVNANLSSLKVDGTSVSGFNPSKTSYTVTTENSSVVIAAAAESSKATVSGDIGTVNLKVGNNALKVTVTAESGATKDYNITVNRVDNRDTNNYLKSLFVENGSLAFKKTTTSYTVNVASNIATTTILAEPESSKATVSGDTGSKNLKYGSNKFTIKVTAENESVKTYTLNIVRADDRDSNNYLKTLTVSEGTLEFNKETTSYTVNVENTVEKIEITAAAESDKASLTGDTGVKTLKEGSNKYTIKVTAENESVKTYKITVNRAKKGTSADDISNIKYIKTLTVEGYELNFDPAVEEYQLNLNDEDTSLFLNYELEDGITAVVEGNEDLVNGSIVKLVLSKGDYSKEYTINIVKNTPSDDIEEPSSTIGPVDKDKKGSGWLKYVIIAVALIVISAIYMAFKNKKKGNEQQAEDANSSIPEPTMPESTVPEEPMEQPMSQEGLNAVPPVENPTPGSTPEDLTSDIEKLFDDNQNSGLNQ